ncbi:Protein kinase domain [Trypanosoma melophagium]|uniref:Protein kinase domain n=1 Tax=Trypanosoma melophagium TaxID=715481 RepID=UPI00351A85ED|nr:Protein kinase domain [Trypanosoma melophagium]KAH9577693.1 Protein kinase domain [Trypanosoma melophagium]
MDVLREMPILGREVQLSELLGAGSNGRVYLAVPMRPCDAANRFPYPSRFVVKVMQRELWPAGQFEGIRKEINALRSLQHPFIVSYVGAWVETGGGEHSGSVCLAMTYCDGGDLHQMICEYIKRDEYVPNELVMRIIVQILSALNHSHAHHIIHRDIKPANLFLMRDGSADGVSTALVGDYGLARPVGRTVELARTRVGTPCYCSPEIVAGEAYTAKTDIFSAGVTFFELMARQRAFWEKGYTERQSFHAILNADPLPRLRRAANGRYDSCLVRAVAACLSKTERGRPTAFELLTGFATRLTGYVRAKNIPVTLERPKPSPTRADGNSPVRRTSSVAPVSPVRRMSPVAPVSPVRRMSPVTPVSRLRRGTPVREAVAGAPPVVPNRTPTPPPVAAAAAKAGAGVQNDAAGARRGLLREGASEHPTPAADLLLNVMEANMGNEAECTKLKELLDGDTEAFMLVQILLVTRCTDTTSLENGIFRLLLTLKPQIAADKVVLWLMERNRGT